MWNDYRLEVDIASILEDFEDLRIKIRMPEGLPNASAREGIRITDMAPIVKSADGSAMGELVNRRWSWPGQAGKPIHNVRSEARDLDAQRCLVLCDGFYEATDPTNKARKHLDKSLFTLKDHRWFCMAGIWRDAHVGEAFGLLTMDAGPDIAPYNDRQIIPLPRDRWADWLDPRVPASETLTWLPEGSLEVMQVHGASAAQGALAL